MTEQATDQETEQEAGQAAEQASGSEIDQERPFFRVVAAVILGLMTVLYLALVLLGGVDYATGFQRVLYVFIAVIVVFAIGLSVAALRKTTDPRRIFILYDKQDARFVSKLYDALKMAPFKVLWDTTEVQVGDNIEEKLKELFDSSSDIIFVVSHRSAAANWAGSAIAKAIKRNKRIFPVLLDEAELPEALRGIKAADFRLSFDDGYFSLREALRTRKETAPRSSPDPQRVTSAQGTTDGS